jgi:hypothetical protein
MARDWGITLVPEIASLGHSRFITRLPRYQHLNENDDAYSGMCPVHPETREVLSLLIRETMEIFDSPEIHVGLDEVEIGTHPMTRNALRTTPRDQIISDHIRFVHSLVVAEGGRRMWMWGDGLLASPALLEMIPKDIVVCNWQYRPTANQSSTQTLLDAGFDVITASAILSHDQTLSPSNDYSLRNIHVMQSHHHLHGSSSPAKVRGEIVTTWMPSRSLSQAQWLGWHLATCILADGESMDLDAEIRRFGREFHGLDQTDAWLKVCQTLLENAPQRDEWLAVLKLELDALPADSENTRANLAGRWLAAKETILRVSPLVRRNRVGFDAFVLIIRLLAHAYEAAAFVQDMQTKQIEESEILGTLLRHRRELAAELDAAWDRERFADDPAKFLPVVRFFRDDHLLLVVGDGLRALEARFAQSPILPQYIV